MRKDTTKEKKSAKAYVIERIQSTWFLMKDKKVLYAGNILGLMEYLEKRMKNDKR